MASTNKKYTPWHLYFALLLDKLLTPVGVQVHAEYKVMTEPPQADVVLQWDKNKFWTNAQRARMPNGVRDSQAYHLILEFKYTESANLMAFQKTLGYDAFYRDKHKLERSAVETFLVSSITPNQELLDNLGYQQKDHNGVYRSSHLMMKQVTLLILNELSDAPYNAYAKMFASRQDPKTEAQQYLVDDVLPTLPQSCAMWSKRLSI
ncbi:MAG: hypothetical protein AAF639_25170 [Chloroflexota bacterium]